MYKGVGGREGGGEGGSGWVGGFSEPETQAAQLSAQELTETATVGLDHGKGQGGCRGAHWYLSATLLMPSNTPTGS